MNNPKFSIIVPVYNAEATIGRTIDILKELDYEEYEVVLVMMDQQIKHRKSFKN